MSERVRGGRDGQACVGPSACERLSQRCHLDDVVRGHLGRAHLSDVLPDAAATFAEQVRTDQLLCFQRPLKVLQSQDNQPAQRHDGG